MKTAISSRSHAELARALLLCVALAPAVASSSTLGVVDTLAELRALEGGAFRAVETLGYHDPSDGAGGLFVWTPGYDGDIDGHLRIRPDRVESGAWIRRISDGVLNVRWFGARGDARADDTVAIQTAFSEAKRAIEIAHGEGDASGFSIANPTVFFPPGEYHVYDQITITGGPIRIQGRGIEGPGASRLRYMGEAFVDLLHIDLTGPGSREVMIFDMALYGGRYNQGRARYVINAQRFTRSGVIERCVIRDGVGLLRLDGCWYANVSRTQIRNVTPRPDWLTPEQLLEVHGPDSAPVYLTGGGSFGMDRCALSYLALDRDMPVQTHRSVFIRSQATAFTTNSIEAVRGNAYPDYLLWVSGNVNVESLYMEGNIAARALVKVQGGSTLSAISRAMFYHVEAPVLFENEGVGDLVVRDGFFYRLRAGKLWEVNAPAFGSSGTAVIFDNCLVMAGERTGNRRVGFAYDMAGNPHAQLGIADGTGGRPDPRQIFPRIESGYEVEFGRDTHGLYVEVDGGVFHRENGAVVGNRQLNMADGVEVADPGEDRDVAAEMPPLRKQYLRFDEDPAERRGRWYRLMIGRGGQPYLVASEEEPTEKTGNWILQFRVGENDRPIGIFRNPLLEMEGGYAGIGSDRSLHLADGPPAEGFWVEGDRVRALRPASGAAGVAEWVCVESGSPGRWTPLHRLAADR